MGGDEFAILCPGTDTAGLEVLAERVTRVVGDPIALGVGTVSVGASVGVASSPPGACSVDVLVDAADQALYSAKAAAGGSWRLAGDGPGPGR
jgi:diguanylate cyclase (GGDEF)-like protein